MPEFRTPYTKFGETRLVPWRVYRADDQSRDHDAYDETLWVETSEDYYALLSLEWRHKRVLLVKRRDWLKAPRIDEESHHA